MPEIIVSGEVVLFDEEDAELVLSRNWYLHHQGYAYSYQEPRGSMHRMILNAPPGVRCDHKNRNRRDNRRCNLRLCDAAENGWNAGARVGQFKGTHVHMTGFRAEIRFRGAKIYAGWAKTEEAAARLYDLKAIELHGEFACLNFPREDYGPDAAEKYGKCPRPLLSPDEVAYILSSQKSGLELARELGWSASLISKVRSGGDRYAEWTAPKKARRITAEEIRYIRSSNARGVDLARELGFSQGLISTVRNGKGRYAAVSTDHMAEAVQKVG